MVRRGPPSFRHRESVGRRRPACRGDRRLHRRVDPHPDRESSGRGVRRPAPASSASGCALATSRCTTSRPTAGPSTPGRIRASTSSAVAAGASGHPLVHLNGHFDVVPAGDGWTVDPFGGMVRDGRIYGRGACDMKAGIAAAVYAAEAIRARRRRACPAPSKSAARSTKRAAASPASHYLAEQRSAQPRQAPTTSSSPSRSTSTACASGTAASTGSRSRRAAASAMAACRFSAPAPSRAWVEFLHLVRGAAQAAAGGADDGRAGRAAGRASRHHQHQRHRRRATGGRHADAVRGRPLPRRVRPPLPASRRGSTRRETRSRRWSTRAPPAGARASASRCTTG